MSIDIEDLEAFPEEPDFRRANGSPMVIIDGKNERFSRPSSAGKILDDDSALTNWRIDRAIAGVAGDPALQARAVAVEDGDRKTLGQIREAAISAGRGAESADIGTALHKMSERFEQEEDFDPPSPYKESLEAYVEGMERFGLKSKHFEFKTVNTEYRTAGTADRLYELTQDHRMPDGSLLPKGTLVVGDLKTGSKLDYSVPGYVVQFALYAQGQFYDPLEDDFMETPEINQKWAVLVHMPAKEPGVCTFWWANLDQGNHGAWVAHEVKEWRKKWRSKEFGLEPLKDPEMSVLRTMKENLGAREVDMKAWVLERISQVKQDPAAMERLLQKWPDGVPTPKNGLSEPDHLQKLDELLSTIEADFGLSFIPAKEIQE